jgi:AbrB family looped-hinge helix DNA binding protein
MPAAVVTSKGQITIPLAVRRKLGLDAGDRVEFIDLGDGRFGLIPATEEISTLKGSVRRPSRPVGVAAMNRAIRKRAAAR